MAGSIFSVAAAGQHSRPAAACDHSNPAAGADVHANHDVYGDHASAAYDDEYDDIYVGVR